MKIFLTGGTGLLGSYFAETATGEGARAVALVRSNSNTASVDQRMVAQLRAETCLASSAASLSRILSA